MARTKYYYNAKTLRYERARLSVSGILSTAIGLLAFGAVFFIGVFYLQNKLKDTPAERQLRIENAALKNHYKVLSAKLETSKSNLNELVKKEDNLYSTFFDASPEPLATSTVEENILIADEAQFDQTIKKIHET